MPSPTPKLPRPSAQDAPRTGLRPAQTAALAASADALLILLFAAIGRDAHQRGDIVTGVFATAWPFLAGAALAWLALRLWHDPLRVWPAGVAVWLGTVGVGMILRAVTGQTVVLPFIIVALLSLGVFLLGYRLVASGVRRVRSRRRQG
jgi:peptidoglycan/LPS O-acetylase OafA/YrhL